MRLTRRGMGFGVVVAALCALVTATGTTPVLVVLVPVASVLLVAPLAAVSGARRARRRLQLRSRLGAPSAPVGAEVQLVIEIANRGAGSVPVVWIPPPADRWQVGTPARRRLTGILLAPRLVALSPPEYGQVTTSTSVVPTGRRSVMVLPAQRAWVLDPFGLCGAPGPLLPAAAMVVYPAPLASRHWERAGEQDAHNGMSRSSGRDGPGELTGVRPYVQGDRLALLHWQSLARYGSWNVKQLAGEDATRGRLVLDDRLGVHHRADFEHMLGVVHGLIEHAARSGHAVELATLAGRHVVVEPTPRSLAEARVLLAEILPAPSATWARPAGTVVTTSTGARTLPAGVERVVVGR